ncbi:MAG: transglutaminase-like domain-containing protein [Bacillota bacterium]|nr:transglutaminase-like domain-containing protein [Bacillota bacterium]
MGFSNIKNIIKENKLKTLILVLVTFLSALLIVTSINMLSFSSDGKSNRTASNDAGNGKDKNSNKKSGNNQGKDSGKGHDSKENGDDSRENGNDRNNNNNQNNGQDQNDNNDNSGYNDQNGRNFNFNSPDDQFGQGDNNQSQQGRDYNSEAPNDNNESDSSNSDPEEDSRYPNFNYKIPDDLKERLKNKMPEFNIDLSQGDGLPKGNYFGGDTYSVTASKKRQHDPIFEILGKLDGPFLKMTVQDQYSNNKWQAGANKEGQVYNYKADRSLKECKIKLVNPGNGFIPVPCNLDGVKVPVLGILNYPEDGVFYSDFQINDYYEAFLKEQAPKEYMLEYCDVDSSVGINSGNRGDVKELVDGIVKGNFTPYKKIVAIANYLKANYKVGTVKNKANTEALTRFLADKKGSQLDFVSTFVALLRYAGIPARLVTGYRVKPDLQYQVVYSDQLCVYPEVCFEKYGWVPMDYFAEVNPINPPSESVTQITKLSETAIKGNIFEVNGNVKDLTGKGLDGQKVLVYLKKDKQENTLSFGKGVVKNGVFNIRCALNEKIDVGSYQVIARSLANLKYKESDSDPELKVLAETDMSIESSKVVMSGGNIKIGGTFTEKLSKKPVKSGEAEIWYYQISDKEQDKKQLVHVKGQVEDGKFAASAKLFTDKGVKPDKNYFFFCSYTALVSGKYLGSDYYIPSSNDTDINLVVVYWGRILGFIIILIIVAAVAIIISLKRRKSQLALSLPDGMGLESLNEKYRSISGQQEEVIELLEISFPDISPDLGDVWGINEILRVWFTDSYGNSDELRLRFDKKGRERISVLPIAPNGKRVTRFIRIVCYGEETLRLGKILYEALYDKFGLMSVRLTPREIIKSLKMNLKDVRLEDYTSEDMEELVLILEKAAYSSEEIKRQDYERFYRFVSAMKNNKKGKF